MSEPEPERGSGGGPAPALPPQPRADRAASPRDSRPPGASAGIRGRCTWQAVGAGTSESRTRRDSGAAAGRRGGDAGGKHGVESAGLREKDLLISGEQPRGFYFLSEKGICT